MALAWNTRVRDLSHLLFPRLASSMPNLVQPPFQSVIPTRHVRVLQRAAELAWGLYDTAQTAGRERDLFLPLAIECCKVVHHVVLIPGIWEPTTTTDDSPPSLTENIEDLLLVLQGIRDQFRSLQVDQETIHHRIEQSRRDMNRLDRIFNPQEQSPPTGGYSIPLSIDVGRRVLPWLRISLSSTSLLIVNMTSRVYMILLLNIPSLYASRIQKILVGTERKSASLEMRHLTPRPEDGPGASQPEHALVEPWNTFSRTLVEEWASFRILSGLILAAIFSMFQISGLWGNQLMMVAALFSFAALIYGAVLTIYVNGWKDNFDFPMWVKGACEPPKIGFIWSPWILLGLPAIWTTWGVIFFFISMMMLSISAQEDDPEAKDLVPFDPDEPAQSTMSPRSAVSHPWFIPLFAIVILYLMLMICTLRGLSRRRQSPDGAVV